MFDPISLAILGIGLAVKGIQNYLQSPMGQKAVKDAVHFGAHTAAHNLEKVIKDIKDKERK